MSNCISVKNKKPLGLDSFQLVQCLLNQILVQQNQIEQTQSTNLSTSEREKHLQMQISPLTEENARLTRENNRVCN